MILWSILRKFARVFMASCGERVWWELQVAQAVEWESRDLLGAGILMNLHTWPECLEAIYMCK